MERLETDPGIRAFLDYTSEQLIKDIRRKVFEDLDYELNRRVSRPVAKGETAEPPQIVQYIHECRRTVEALILEHISGYYSANRWLYYSRRIPNLAFPNTAGWTDFYKIGLLEAMTGQVATVSDDPYPLNYPLHQSVINRVLRFSQEILYLSNFHVALHQAAKGVPSTFDKSAIPVPMPTSAVSNALSLFDWRVATFDQKPLAGLGTEAHNEASIASVERVFAVVPRLKESVWIRNPASPDESKKASTLLSNYGLQFVDLRELGRLITDQRLASLVWSKETGALLMLLRIAGEMSSDLLVLASILEVGYVPMSRETLARSLSTHYKSGAIAVRDTVPKLSVPDGPEALLHELQEMRSSLWPVMPGPVVRTCGEGTVYLDLSAATRRLDRAFKFPRITGMEANARAKHFEQSVQSVVDSSRWSDSTAKSLQGRTLRHNGTYITDVDAVGAREGKLLLISCKSILYAEYEIADFRVLRNAADLVQKAVVEWNQICSFLRDNRVGENYDLSGYDKIMGVVCTPVVIYTPLGIATERAAGGLYARSRYPNFVYGLRDKT